jgi:flagellar motility protein MotE (MotC chaperone)
MKLQKKPSMSKEQAVELYNDLQRAMNKMIKNTAGMRSAKDKVQQREIQTPNIPIPSEEELQFFARKIKGKETHKGVLMLVAALVIARTLLGAVEFAIGTTAQPAYAKSQFSRPQHVPGTFDRSEIALLKQLDSRRAELEKRRESLDMREAELDTRDKEYGVKIAELRELTKQLSSHRQQSLRKRQEQIEQLAKVYTSMNPPEAASLIQQLDPQIAIALLERMPDKRMAQILSLMSPDKALMFTKMLTGRFGS